MPRHCLATLVLLLGIAAPALAGCGRTDRGRGAGEAATATTAAVPALATRPAGPGEIVIRGEASPATHGPYAFAGRYLVRFAQYAPEDAALDFSGQTPFTAALRGVKATRAEPRAVRRGARRGRRIVEIRGPDLVDVSFGDFPYVLRFTPRTG